MSHHNNAPRIVDRIIEILDDDERKHALVGNHILRSSNILQARQRDKQELQILNESLDEFVKKISRLDGQNRSLVNLTRQGEEQFLTMKENFKRDIDKYQTNIDSALKSKSGLETQIERLESDLTHYKIRFNLSGNGLDEDIGTSAEELKDKLRKRQEQLQSDLENVKSLERDIQELKTKNKRLLDELQQVNKELDQENFNRFENINRLSFLEEKKNFLNELGELDQPPGQRAAYAKVVDCRQIAASIREIQGEFNDHLIENRSHLDRLRNVKVNVVNHGLRDIFNDEKARVTSEIERYLEKVTLSENENNRLKQNLADFKQKVATERNKHVEELTQLELKLKSLVKENVRLQDMLKALINDNHSLTAELAIYRKMIGAQANVRTPTVGSAITIQLPASPSQVRVIGEKTVRTIYIRESTPGCHIRFGKVPYDGKYVMLENLGDKDEVMDSWKIVQNHIGTVWEELFVFPSGYTLNAHTSTGKIWNRNQGTSSEYQFKGTWDGQTSTTINLLDKNERVKASYNHKTTTIVTPDEVNS